MNKYQFVLNYRLFQIIKKGSKYFKTDLGHTITLDKNGDKVINETDEFSRSYTLHYKSQIHSSGKIGGIQFYIDHNIKDNTIICFHKYEDFIYNIDFKMIEEKGIDSYLGFLLKDLDNKYIEVKEEENKKQEIKKGNANKLFTNPGAVTYEDLKEYLKQKNGI